MQSSRPCNARPRPSRSPGRDELVEGRCTVPDRDLRCIVTSRAVGAYVVVRPMTCAIDAPCRHARAWDEDDDHVQDACGRSCCSGSTPLLAIMVGLGLWAIVMFSPARRQHRRDPPGELPERPGRREHEGGAGADGLGRCCSPSAARRSGPASSSREYRPVFEKNLKIEQSNVTLPGRAGSWPTS